MKAKRAVSLGTALKEKSQLRKHIQPGLQAVSSAHVQLFDEGVRRKVGDSLDLDAASRAEFPAEHRWDYLVSFPGDAQIVGVEPHTARDSEISVVIAKKEQARAYLRTHLRDGHRVSRWIWVTSGKVDFSTMERARRFLDQNGIEFAGRLLRKVGRDSE